MRASTARHEFYRCYRSGYTHRIARPKRAGRKLGHAKRLWCPLCGCEHNLYRIG